MTTYSRPYIIRAMQSGLFLFKHPWRLAKTWHEKGQKVPGHVAMHMVDAGLIRPSASNAKRTRWVLTRKGMDFEDGNMSKAAAPRCDVHKKRGVYCECGVAVRPCCQDGRETCDWCDHLDAEYAARRSSPRGNKPDDAARILYGGRRL